MATPALVNTASVISWNHKSVRDLERYSLRQFMESNRNLLSGRVIDYGAGKPGTCFQPQPYRDLVIGQYVPIDIDDALPQATHDFDAVICTQVVQYLQYPLETLQLFSRDWLRPGGKLLLTGPTNWAEVEDTDLHRFTRAGISRLLRIAGFEILRIDNRAELNLGGFKLSLGWGAVAQRK